MNRKERLMENLVHRILYMQEIIDVFNKTIGEKIFKLIKQIEKLEKII